jgi:hypothetical protein
MQISLCILTTLYSPHKNIVFKTTHESERSLAHKTDFISPSNDFFIFRAYFAIADSFAKNRVKKAAFSRIGFSNNEDGFSLLDAEIDVVELKLWFIGFV